VLLGDVGQQAEGGQPHQEAVRRRPGTQAEGGPQRSLLRTRETLEAVQHRRAQLVHPGEGELHLRLDTHSTRHPAARGVLHQVVQQRRLAHARVTAHHQGPALTGANRVEEPVQHVAFAAPTRQRPGGAWPAGGTPSARHRHYGAPATPAHDPRLGGSCAASSIGASTIGLGACTRKLPHAMPTSTAQAQPHLL
jgi:hypothetical protein